MPEFARCTMSDNDPDANHAADEAQLRALIEAHEVAFARMAAQLDRADAAVERMLAHFAAKNKAR